MRCVPAYPFTVAKARAWRSAIDDAPVYQRASDVWTLDQRQRFIDSLLAGYDVPKIYLHDLRGQHPTKVYAVVDGKQRLTAIWEYLADAYPLGSSVPAISGPDGRASGSVPFSGLSPEWQRQLQRTHLSVVLIKDAEEVDIDALFARLNSGAPLADADRRNALGGDMAALIRTIAERDDLLTLAPGATLHSDRLEAAATVIAMALTSIRAPAAPPDLEPAALDAMVRAGRRLSTAEREAIVLHVERRLVPANRAGADAQSPADHRSNVTG